MAGRDDPKFKAVVTSAPRFGTLNGGGLRLVSAAGELRLRRVGPARTMTGGVMTRMWREVGPVTRGACASRLSR